MATTFRDFINGVLEGVTAYNVTSFFGPRTYTIGGKLVSDTHSGIDLTPTAKVKAFQRGKVIEVRNNVPQSKTPEIVANKLTSMYSGNYVKISHGNGVETVYMHLADGSIPVRVGDVVEKGAIIGMVGSTGYSTGNHLHFGIKINGVAVDPLPYLQGKKTIAPYADPVTSTEIATRPDLPKLKVNVNDLRYRDAANGKILGELAINESYPYLGKTASIAGYVWAQIIKGSDIVFCALNPNWNTLIDIEPKVVEKVVEVDKPINSVMNDGRIEVTVKSVAK